MCIAIFVHWRNSTRPRAEHQTAEVKHLKIAGRRDEKIERLMALRLDDSEWRECSTGGTPRAHAELAHAMMPRNDATPRERPRLGEVWETTFYRKPTKATPQPVPRRPQTNLARPFARNTF